MHAVQGYRGHAFENGYRFLENNEVAVVGISLGNSYFKAGNITELVDFASANFSETGIMLPDKPMEHTYKAMGNSDFKARRKARLHGNNLATKVNTAIGNRENVYLLDWSEDIEKDEKYAEEFAKIVDLYHDHLTFQGVVRHTTKKVLKASEPENMDDAIDEGIYFVLKELAFMSAAPEMFESNVAYIYHQQWPIFERFVRGDFYETRDDLGMIVVQ